MNSALYFNKFSFVEFKFNKYKYTDNRKGVDIHFIAILKKGNAKIVTDEETILLNPGDVFYIPKDLSYESYWFGEKIEWQSYGFTYFPENENRRYKLQKISCSEKLKTEVLNIPVNESVDSKTLGIFFTVLSKLLGYMNLDEKGNNEKLLRKAIELIEEDPYLSVGEIAKKCNVCVSTLFNNFKRVYGKTPNRIKQEILCKKAISLLTATDKPIGEISDILNFSSTSYFRKTLFSVTGKTPSRIRKEKTTI